MGSTKYYAREIPQKSTNIRNGQNKQTHTHKHTHTDTHTHTLLHSQPPPSPKQNALCTYGCDATVEDLNPLDVQIAQCQSLTNLCLRVMGNDSRHAGIVGERIRTEIVIVIVTVIEIVVVIVI